MDNGKMLKALNPVLGLLLLAQAGTGMFGDRLPEELFHELHEWGARLLVAAAALHVYLNRGWIKNAYFGGNKP